MRILEDNEHVVERLPNRHGKRTRNPILWPANALPPASRLPVRTMRVRLRERIRVQVDCVGRRLRARTGRMPSECYRAHIGPGGSVVVAAYGAMSLK